MKNKSIKPILLKFLVINITVFFFSSCVWKYVTPTHNTPCFTDKKQFEGSCGGGLTGMSANLAYSPVKYLSLQLNGYSSLTAVKTPPYNNQLEVAVGGYLPLRHVITGISAGCGVGTTNWKRWWYSGDAYTPLENLQFDTKKIYLDYYAAYKWRSNTNFSGLSAKVNFMENFYHRAVYSWYEKNNYTRQQCSFELTYFIKLKISRSIYLNFNWGIHLLNGDEGQSFDIHPLGQVGLTVKI